MILHKRWVRPFVSSGLTTAFVALSLSLGLAHGPMTPSEDPHAAVRDTLISVARAFGARDLHALEERWADRDDVIVFERGQANYGWRDYRDRHLLPELRELQNVEYSIADIRTKVNRRTARSTFTHIMSADFSGRSIEAADVGTAVLKWRDKAWKIVRWHTSSPSQSPC